MSNCSDGEDGEQDDEPQEKKPNTNNGKQIKQSTNQNKKIEDEPPVKEKKPSVPRAPWRAKKEEKEKEKAEEEAKKKTKTKNKILASMPANWQEEEEKFFASNFDYNPQFTYDRPATNKRFLKMFPAPKFEYLP